MRSPLKEWSSDEVPPDSRTDAWAEILTRLFGEWKIPYRLPSTFSAEIKYCEFDGVKLVRADCDMHLGRRIERQVRREDKHLVGFHLMTSGAARYISGNDVVTVGPGSLSILTTGREVDVEILERSRTISLMVPWSLMQRRFPGRKKLPSNGLIDPRAGIGALIVSQLTTLSNEIAAMPLAAMGAVNQSTLELLNVALADQQSSTLSDPKSLALLRIKEFILRHLHDEDLNPAKVAMANQVSVRYLHALFRNAGTSVCQYILAQRLEACKRALATPALHHKHISEIAFHWGFRSLNHFCRTFKQRYQITPTETRAHARAGSA